MVSRAPAFQVSCTYHSASWARFLVEPKLLTSLYWLNTPSRAFENAKFVSMGFAVFWRKSRRPIQSLPRASLFFMYSK